MPQDGFTGEKNENKNDYSAPTRKEESIRIQEPPVRINNKPFDISTLSRIPLTVDNLIDKKLEIPQNVLTKRKSLSARDRDISPPRYGEDEAYKRSKTTRLQSRDQSPQKTRSSRIELSPKKESTPKEIKKDSTPAIKSSRIELSPKKESTPKEIKKDSTPAIKSIMSPRITNNSESNRSTRSVKKVTLPPVQEIKKEESESEDEESEEEEDEETSTTVSSTITDHSDDDEEEDNSVPLAQTNNYNDNDNIPRIYKKGAKEAKKKRRPHTKKIWFTSKPPDYDKFTKEQQEAEHEAFNAKFFLLIKSYPEKDIKYNKDDTLLGKHLKYEEYQKSIAIDNGTYQYKVMIIGLYTTIEAISLKAGYKMFKGLTVFQLKTMYRYEKMISELCEERRVVKDKSSSLDKIIKYMIMNLVIFGIFSIIKKFLDEEITDSVHEKFLDFFFHTDSANKSDGVEREDFCSMLGRMGEEFGFGFDTVRKKSSTPSKVTPSKTTPSAEKKSSTPTTPSKTVVKSVRKVSTPSTEKKSSTPTTPSKTVVKSVRKTPVPQQQKSNNEPELSIEPPPSFD
jgi:hypothetical protein